MPSQQIHTKNRRELQPLGYSTEFFSFGIESCFKLEKRIRYFTCFDFCAARISFAFNLKVNVQFQIPTLPLASSHLASAIKHPSHQPIPRSPRSPQPRHPCCPSSFASEDSLVSALGVRPAWIAPKRIGAFNSSELSATARSFVRFRRGRHPSSDRPRGDTELHRIVVHRCLSSILLDVPPFGPVRRWKTEPSVHEPCWVVVALRRGKVGRWSVVGLRQSMCDMTWRRQRRRQRRQPR